MATTFDQARREVERRDYDVAPYGYETDDEWLLVLLPERVGARVPAVSKRTGQLRWIHTHSPEYTEQRPVGRYTGKP